MTPQEFSNEFDVLYNQVNSNQAPGLDEYEKSVVLTKAEDEIVLMYFNARGNKFMQGMDDAPDKQYGFSTLIKKNTYTLSQNNNTYDPRAFEVTLTDDILLIINESVVDSNKNGTIYQVRPISYYEYTRLMEKPFKFPTKHCVWRLITDLNDSKSSTTPDSSDQDSQYQPSKAKLELIGYGLSSNCQYRLRYLALPDPIILVDLPSGLSIRGKNVTTGCLLPEALHGQILQRAVELATAIYNPLALNNLVGVGNVSATNLGIVPSKDNRS